MAPSRLRGYAAATLILLSCLTAATAQQNTVVASLERYGQGDFGGGISQLLGTKNVRSIQKEFRKNASAWIDRAPEPERAQRIAAAGAMTLELVAASFDQHAYDYYAARDLIEWACEHFRKQAPSEVERWFDMAAIALAQGAADQPFIDGNPARMSDGRHAKHPLDRFPDEPRFKLALATVYPEAQQITTWPLTPAMIIRPASGGFFEDETQARQAMDDTLEALAKLFDDSVVGAEAHLRSGVLRFLREQGNAARTDLEQAANADDPAVRHLAHLMLGTIADREKDVVEAMDHYRLAYEAVPAATASIALASSLYRAGAVDDATKVLQAFQSSSPPPDPWEFYGQRDFRAFEAYRYEMRGAVAALMGRRLPGGLPPLYSSRSFTIAMKPSPRPAAVELPVLVQSGGKPVANLSVADFVVTDSGVEQVIAAVEPGTKALDVTVVAQETTETKTGKYVTLDAEIATVANALTPEDRLTVMLAGRDPRPFTPPGTRDLVKEAAREKRCVPIYDTVARALMQPVTPDRERVVILISAGEGRGGFLTTGPVAEIARRANARLYVANLESHYRYDHVADAVCPGVGADFSEDRRDRLRLLGQDRGFKGMQSLQNDEKLRLVKIAESTGGRELRSSLTGGTSGSLRGVVADIRASYTLRYVPAGVPVGGWHPIAVKVTRAGRYDIRARPGYER